ncbi:MAG TPA: serine/threonine-protein kinase [Kofleriaceae bacterium]|nr:serine/threonine-protein kinase [Kofleriaceae bacterium]
MFARARHEHVRQKRHATCCSAVMPPTPPAVIDGRYRLESLVGAGGMGTVFRAHDLRSNQDVALKLLHPERLGDARAVAYFRREGQTAGRLRHAHLVTVLATGEVAGEPYLVMRLVPGRPLRDLIRDGELPTVSRAISIISQVLSGLEAIHAAGFVHGDVKADNVLIEDDDRATLIDLGLMRSQSESCDGADGFVSGTPDYMAPEIIHGEGGRIESDLYSVGALLYELLTGSTPFAGGTAPQILHRQLTDIVVPPSMKRPERSFPRALEEAVLWALAKRPEDRPHNARAFACRLLEALPSHDTSRDDERWPVPTTFSTTAPTLCWKRAALPEP